MYKIAVRAASGLCLGGVSNYFHKMAESKKTTRGENNVRNFGRAAPALSLIMNWLDTDLYRFPQLQSILRQFFMDQAGGDDQLKFWHVGIKQFPKWNEVLSDNTEGALSHYFDSYRDAGAPPPSNDRNKPTGMTDPYLHADPMSKSDWGMPFVVIHTREIKPTHAARAALVAIENDECLRNLFDWSRAYDDEEILEWHGKRLLGLSDKHEEEMRKARKVWYIPKVRSSKPQSFKVIVSDSVVRTINWHLQETRAGIEFEVERMDELRRRIRSKRWPMPSALKSYRIDWPVVRNLEEAALITKTSQTALLTDFISKHAGQHVCDHLKSMYDSHVADYEKHKWEEDYCAPEPYEAEEMLQDKYEKYRRVVAPFKGQVVPQLKLADDTNKAEQRMLEISDIQDKFINKLQKLKDTAPELFSIGSSGGHLVSKGHAGTEVNRLAKAPETVLEDTQLIQAAIASPIPIPDTKPAVYDLIRGQLGNDGVSVTEDFQCHRFVGYEITLTRHQKTFAVIAEWVNEFAKQHFPPGLYEMGGFSVWPSMIEWANPHTILGENPENMKIICPDPRTLNENMRKPLEAK